MRRIPSPLFDARKEHIRDPWLRDAVDLAEEEILADRPAPLRRDRIEIDGIIYDHSEHGVMLAYEIIDGDGVRFLAFADLWNT